MNAICSQQNSELQLERLAAQRSLYNSAKRVFSAHAILSTVLAAGLSFGAAYFAGLRPFALVWGGVWTMLDILWLTPCQKKLREAAATIQESFDCDVLQLPWQPLKAEKPVDHELVVERAAKYRQQEPSFESLRDWYPADVCRMPLFLARVVCQRINAWWDAKQRRQYAFLLIGLVVALLLSLVAVGIAQTMRVNDLLMTMAPHFPGLLLGLRQYKENAEAAARLEKLKDHANKLWNRALIGATEDELAAGSRALQDELFEHRKRNVPVFDWLYWLLRGRHEAQMQEGAAQLVTELKAAREARTANRFGS